MTKRSSSSGSSDLKRARIDLSLDAFDCSICMHSMLKQIVQCPTGHSVCEDCLPRIRSGSGKCPSCHVKYVRKPPRNFAMESLIAQISFPCQFGCGATALPADLLLHQKSCSMRPIRCIIAGCDHSCPCEKMKDHLRESHKEEMLFWTQENPLQQTLKATDVVWAKCVVLTVGNKAMWLHQRRIEGGVFMVQAIHFEQPMMYELLLGNDEYDKVSIRGRSISIAHVGQESNIKLPLCVFGHVLDNKGEGHMSISATAIKDAKEPLCIQL